MPSNSKQPIRPRDITILYRDIRTFAFKEDYYKQAREANIKFISYEENRKPEVMAAGDKVEVKVFDPILNEPISLPADAVVLSVGVVPNPEMRPSATC